MCLITFQGSILKETNPEYSLEGVMLKLKPWYSGHLMRKVDSLEKTLMLAKNGGRRRRDDRGWRGWMASLTQWTWVWANSGRWWRTGEPGVLQSVGSQRVGRDWATGGSAASSVPCSILLIGEWAGLQNGPRLRLGSLFFPTLPGAGHTSYLTHRKCVSGSVYWRIIQQTDRQVSERNSILAFWCLYQPHTGFSSNISWLINMLRKPKVFPFLSKSFVFIKELLSYFLVILFD